MTRFDAPLYLRPASQIGRGRRRLGSAAGRSTGAPEKKLMDAHVPAKTHLL